MKEQTSMATKSNREMGATMGGNVLEEQATRGGVEQLARLGDVLRLRFTEKYEPIKPPSTLATELSAKIQEGQGSRVPATETLAYTRRLRDFDVGNVSRTEREAIGQIFHFLPRQDGDAPDFPRRAHQIVRALGVEPGTQIPLALRAAFGLVLGLPEPPMPAWAVAGAWLVGAEWGREYRAQISAINAEGAVLEGLSEVLPAGVLMARYKPIADGGPVTAIDNDAEVPLAERGERRVTGVDPVERAQVDRDLDTKGYAVLPKGATLEFVAPGELGLVGSDSDVVLRAFGRDLRALHDAIGRALELPVTRWALTFAGQTIDVLRDEMLFTPVVNHRHIAADAKHLRLLREAVTEAMETGSAKPRPWGKGRKVAVERVGPAAAPVEQSEAPVATRYEGQEGGAQAWRWEAGE